jgi:hypothetical protein
MKRYIQALPLVLLLSLPAFAMERDATGLITQTTETTTAEQYQNPVYEPESTTTYQLTEGPELVAVVAEKQVDLWAVHRINTDKEFMDYVHEQARNKKDIELTPEKQKSLCAKILISDDSPLFVGVTDRSYSKDPRVVNPKAYFATFAQKAKTIHDKHIKKQITENGTAIQKLQDLKKKLGAEKASLTQRIPKLVKYVGEKNATAFTTKSNARIKAITEQIPTIEKEIKALQDNTAAINSELTWF